MTGIVCAYLQFASTWGVLIFKELTRPWPTSKSADGSHRTGSDRERVPEYPDWSENLAMASSAEVLRQQWSASCDRLLARLSGLTDEEYRWEPVRDCWNVRPCPESPSGWTVDYPQVHPTPPPFTTIAWRLLHIADGNIVYWEHSFGPGLRNFWDLAPHGDAAAAIEYLRGQPSSHHRHTCRAQRRRAG